MSTENREPIFDPKLPTDITAEETAAGFRRTSLRPGGGSAKAVVILRYGLQQRILKARKLETGKIVYVRQIKKRVLGRLHWDESVCHDSLGLAIAWARVHDDLARE